MTDKKTANLAIEEWYSSITKEDKKHKNMPPLFEVLTIKLFELGIPFDIAREAILIGAKKVYPHGLAVKFMYESSIERKTKTIHEFTKNWQENITKIALEAFYCYYQIETTDKKTAVKKKKSELISENNGMKTDDEMNEEDFWKSVKTVNKDKPWVFGDNNE